MRAFYMPDDLKPSLPGLQILFNVLQTFANLPFGLNPKSRREFEIEFSAIKRDPTIPVNKARELVKKMKEHKERYAWNKSWHEKLNTEAFWNKQAKDIQLKRAQWKRIEPFAYYDSSNISYLAFNVLPRIKEQLQVAKKNFGSEFPQFIHDSEQQLKLYQESIAQAMCARLQNAANNKDPRSDDLIYHFLDKLFLVEDLLTRPEHISSPKKNLSRQDFLRFHDYIEQHGNTETLQAFNRLPWRQPNALQKPPSRLRSPRWLFKGRNARYHAFHDRYHQISLLLLSKKIDNPFQAYRAFTLEQKRLDDLKQPLHRFFQRHALNLLQEKINRYKEYRQKILEDQCLQLAILINKEPFSAVDLQESDALLKEIETLEKGDLVETALETKKLSDQLKEKLNEYRTHIIPLEQTIENNRSSKNELENHLSYLLNPNSKDPQYLNKLSQLKAQALMLPDTIQNKITKRLFNAATEIRGIINALPGALISFFQGEIDHIPMINQLLIDIIDANLMLDEEKENIIQLLEIVCAKQVCTDGEPKEALDSHSESPLQVSSSGKTQDIGDTNDQTNLNSEIILALNALKNLLKQTEKENDREHIYQYEKYVRQLSSSSKLSGNIYALSNTNVETKEEHSTSTLQPKLGA